MTVKSSPAEIRARFDADVARFSNLETGQSSTVDARLALDLVAETAAAVTPHAQSVLDVGCGAGNYSLRLLRELPGLQQFHLVDLSQPMLTKAQERLSAQTKGEIATYQADIRELPLAQESVDIILAAAVLHHLRDESEWRAVFANFFQVLRPGGSLWIFDLIEHEHPQTQAVQKRRYGEYLMAFKDEAYRDHVFAYIEQEDTPQTLWFQMTRLSQAGFRQLDVLHKNSCFAAFGGVKPG